MVRILAPISVGDLVDRITILEIKWKTIPNFDIGRELTALRSIAREADIDLLVELQDINQKLWNAEDAVRNSQNDSEFIQAARSIVTLNEQRSRIKQGLNITYKSEFSEAKTYS